MGVDLVLSATPSNTARSGEFVLPIIDSIADSFSLMQMMVLVENCLFLLYIFMVSH